MSSSFKQTYRDIKSAIIVSSAEIVSLKSLHRRDDSSFNSMSSLADGDVTGPYNASCPFKDENSCNMYANFHVFLFIFYLIKSTLCQSIQV